MKLYTKTGDKGKTSIIGGRVDKDHARVEAYGTIDELNSFIGKAITELEDEKFQSIREELLEIQHQLFDAGGDLANVMKNRVYKLEESYITDLENKIDAYSAEAPELTKFILPGGSAAAATLHIARTITRRAERQTVTLQKEYGDVPSLVQRYLNRLSDYLFALARVVNYRQGISDVEYSRGSDVFK